MAITLQSCFKLGMNLIFGAEYINHVLPVSIFRERVHSLRRLDDNNPLHKAIVRRFQNMAPSYHFGDSVTVCHDRYPYAEAPFGNSLLPATNKVVVVDENVWKADRDAGKWLMRHQYTLLKNNYIVKASGAKYAALFASTLLLPFPLALATTCASGLFLNEVIFKERARQQDLESFEKASREELIGAVRYLRAFKLAEFDCQKNQVWLKLKFDSLIKKLGCFERETASRLQDAKSVLKRRFPEVSIKKICLNPRVGALRSYLVGAMNNP
jgi:hypothetical protein